MPTPSAGAAPSFNPGTLDYQADPILQQVLAAQQAALTTSRGNLLSNYKDLLLGYGSKQVAQDTLKTLLKQPGYKGLAGAKDLSKYLDSISDNPDTSQSTLARLGRALREATHGTNEGLSSSQGGNLFFSGTHARALRDLDYESQSQTADAAQALRQALFSALQGETATEGQWQQNVLSAEEAAYSRALEFALAQAARAAGASGGYPGGGGGAAPAGGGTPYTQTPQLPGGGGAPFVPWQAATALSKLAPADLRVRRLQ